MSNPPRRSRPKKPARTIDLGAKTLPAVGYPGPTSDRPGAQASEASASASSAAIASTGASFDGRDAEARIYDAGGGMPATSASDAPRERPGDERTTIEAFASEEGLAGTNPRDERKGDLDDTIMSAAVPDFVGGADDGPDGPPPPTYDYNHTPATTQSDARGSGFGSTLGGALLGAVLALAGAGALQYAGVLPAIGIEDAPDQTAQFASSGDVQQVSTDLGTLRGEVEQLRSAQAAGGTGEGATSGDVTAVADRVTALEQRSDQGAASGAVNEEATTAARTTAESASTAAEEARAAADAARQAAEQAGATAGQSQTTADGARQTAEAASQAATAASQAAATAQQAATGAQTSATAATEAIAAFEPRLAAIETANQQAGIAISAAALKAAIDRGGPFMSELEGFATVSGASPAVDTLRGFAASGVPSGQALTSEWPEVEGQIAAALRPEDPEATVGDQILTGLGALVTSRPVGGAEAGAEGPSASVARLSAAIESGQFQAWLDEWQTLPQPAKDASQSFQARVEARARTDAVVGETLNNAVNAGGQPAAGTAG